MLEMRLNNSEYTPGIIPGVCIQKITVLDNVYKVFKLSLRNNSMSVLQLQRNVPRNTSNRTAVDETVLFPDKLMPV